jgi:hypothetical protein
MSLPFARAGRRVAPRTAPRAAALAPLLMAALGASAEAPIHQSISVGLEQRAAARAIREDGPINAGNALGLPEWELNLSADADWRIDVAQRLYLSLEPKASWSQESGSFDGWEPVEDSSRREDPKLALKGAEARLSFPEIGLEAVYGKLRPEFGANYIEPLSATRRRGSAGSAEGRWMAGLFISLGDLALEAYCETARDPEAVASLSALLGSNEAGILCREEGGEEGGGAFGAWWRGQLGDGLLAYAECMLREDARILDIAGLAPRGIGWNCDALAGLGITPSGAGVSIYLEYRFRQAGYGAADFDALAASPLSAQAAAIAGLPYLQTSRHALGLHARSDEGGGGDFSWSATCVYLGPGGLYLSAACEARMLDRLGIGAELSAAASLGGAASRAAETAFWPELGRCAIYLRWEIDAREEP